MNRFLLLTLLLSFCSFIYSQKREIPATLITHNNDTLKLNMIVGVTLYKNKEIEETTITKGITYRDRENKKKKFEAKDVKKINIY